MSALPPNSGRQNRLGLRSAQSAGSLVMFTGGPARLVPSQEVGR
jgi:hypothetical protein